MNQEYRLNIKLRRRGQPALDTNRVEFQSEEYDDDIEMANALAAEFLMMIQADRAYLAEKYDLLETLESKEADDE
jgi:hypothetical protein